MDNLSDREQNELRLKELEMEIDRQELKTYQTKKHPTKSSSLNRVFNKAISYGKFALFVVGGIALIRAGLLLGMWLAYGVITAILMFIGYQIFLADKNDD